MRSPGLIVTVVPLAESPRVRTPVPLGETHIALGGQDGVHVSGQVPSGMHMALRGQEGAVVGLGVRATQGVCPQAVGLEAAGEGDALCLGVPAGGAGLEAAGVPGEGGAGEAVVRTPIVGEPR